MVVVRADPPEGPPTLPAYLLHPLGFIQWDFGAKRDRSHRISAYQWEAKCALLTSNVRYSLEGLKYLYITYRLTPVSCPITSRYPMFDGVQYEGSTVFHYDVIHTSTLGRCSPGDNDFCLKGNI